MSDMDSLKKILSHKANKIDQLQSTDLNLAQQELDRLYPDATQVIKIDDQTALIKTTSSSIASEMRLNQLNIVRVLDTSLKSTITSIRIFIR